MRSTTRADAVLVFRTCTSTLPGGSNVTGGSIGVSVISVLSPRMPRLNCADAGSDEQTTKATARAEMDSRVAIATAKLSDPEARSTRAGRGEPGLPHPPPLA